MDLLASLKPTWDVVYRGAEDHVGNDDRLATLSNTGAMIIWTHLPAYPLLVWWFVGRPLWPSCILLITVPLFFSVPYIARQSSLVGRAAFAIFGILNTLLAVKAFGLPSGVGWFLLPCLFVASMFYRLAEWKVSGAMSILTGLSALLLSHLQPPLYTYSSAQYASFASLNHWCVGCLCAYLAFVAAHHHLWIVRPSEVSRS